MSAALRLRYAVAMRFLAALALGEPSHFVDVARTADQVGLDGLALSDHVVFPERLESKYPYAPDGKRFWELDAPWPDPWVTIGAMAAVTTRLRFLTNVFILPARNPFLVAKAVGTAAVLSQNRVVLGIGIGWMREEFVLLGQPFEGRGKRADEAIDVLRTLWRGGLVEHHGAHWDFGPVIMSPAPTKPVPIYVGGESDAALRRAARLGDGYISVLRTTDEIRALVAKIQGLRAEAGRASEPFDFVVSVNDAFDVDGYKRLEDAGATSFITVPWLFYGGDPTALETKKAGLERFAEDVLVRMR